MTNDELKTRIFDFIKSRDEDAMLDDLMEQPDIGAAGRQVVAEVAGELKREGKIEGRDLFYGHRQQ